MWAAVLTIVLIWIGIQSKNNENAILEGREVQKDYKDLFDSYKKTWDFDKISIKGKDAIKFMFESWYIVPVEKGVGMVGFIALSLMVFTIFLWAFFQNNILALFFNAFSVAPTEDLLNLTRFLVPVGGWLYRIYLHDKFFKQPPTRYKSGYAEGMFKTLEKVSQAVDIYNTTGENSAHARTARELRVSSPDTKINIENATTGGHVNVTNTTGGGVRLKNVSARGDVKITNTGTDK